MNKWFVSVAFTAFLLFLFEQSFAYDITIEMSCPADTTFVNAGSYISSTSAWPYSLHTAIRCNLPFSYYFDLSCPAGQIMYSTVSIKNGTGFRYDGWWRGTVIDPYQGQTFIYRCHG